MDIDVSNFMYLLQALNLFVTQISICLCLHWPLMFSSLHESRFSNCEFKNYHTLDLDQQSQPMQLHHIYKNLKHHV
jgi:hypothetical protein